MKYRIVTLSLAALILNNSLGMLSAMAQSQINIQHRAAELYQETAIPAITAEEFIQQAALKNLYKIRTGELALDMGYRTTVLQFAQQMIDNHTRALKDLSHVVHSLKMDQDIIPDDLDARYQQQLEALQNTPLDDFDAYYISDQRRMNEQAIEFYSNYIKDRDSQDPEALHRYAVRSLPVLQQHANILEQVDDLVLSGR